MPDETEIQLRSAVKHQFADLFRAAVAAVDESKRRPVRSPAETALERQVEATKAWLAKAGGNAS